MVAAFAVIATVSGIVGTINIVKGWITEVRQSLKGYKEAGKTIQDLDLSFHKCQVELDFWMRMWRVDKPTSRRYQRELWDQRGMEIIATQLTSIKSLSESIQDRLTPLSLGTAPTNLVIGQTANHGIASMSNSDFRNDAKRIKDALSVRAAVAFINSMGPEILKDLSTVREKTIEIRELSLNAYAAKHQIFTSNALTTEQLHNARTSVLLDTAVELRLSSQRLYESCYAASRRISASQGNFLEYIKLELDLLRKMGAMDLEAVSAQGDIIIEYHFLVAWPSRLLELFVEGPFVPEQALALRQTSGQNDGFLSACNATLSKESLSLRSRRYGFDHELLWTKKEFHLQTN